MNTLIKFVLCLLFFYLFPGTAFSFVNPPVFIVDTDLSSDVDDVGAIAVLHALESQGQLTIAAMMVSSGDPWSAPCLDAINTWYGRPDIPIGMIKRKSVRHESKYTQIIAQEFPHDLQKAFDAPDAVSLYREVLGQQEDNSVVIVTVGYLTNLESLLKSQADATSPLDGAALVRRKVKKLVIMGGEYPEGKEWNFYQDAASAMYVSTHWESPITFCGFESGKNVLTGAGLQTVPSPNPIRRSYELYNKLSNRPSWDQVTVLYAALASRDKANVLWTEVFGVNQVVTTGENYWKDKGARESKQSYIQQHGSTSEIATQIEQLMLQSRR